MKRSSFAVIHPSMVRRFMPFLLLAFIPATILAQAPDSARLIAAQRRAMVPMAFLNGVWRGPAWIILPSGQKETFTQTERVGPFLDGSIMVMEGRGYGPEGKVNFNAFGILSYDSTRHTYTLHSYAQGYAGDFVFTPATHGYVWNIPAGPMTIRYTANVKDGVWHEVGDRLLPGKEPVRFFAMDVKRAGDTTWPARGAISPK